MACGACPIGMVAITLLVSGVDRGERVGVFEADIDARAVAGRPDAVRQIADRDGRDLREVVGAEHLDLVECRRS